MELIFYFNVCCSPVPFYSFFFFFLKFWIMVFIMYNLCNDFPYLVVDKCDFIHAYYYFFFSFIFYKKKALHFKFLTLLSSYEGKCECVCMCVTTVFIWKSIVYTSVSHFFWWLWLSLWSKKLVKRENRIVACPTTSKCRFHLIPFREMSFSSVSAHYHSECDQ